MRIKNTLFNTAANIVLLVIRMLLIFFTRKVFIDTLGIEMLGVDGLLVNIISVLAVAELGIGEAISYSLYKPLKDNDAKKISQLMTFFRKAYSCIGFVVLLIGIILYFCLDLFNVGSVSNIIWIYFLYLINTVAIYFISYKETLIIADQKRYKITRIETIFILMMNLLQVFVLMYFKNYILYLAVMLLCNIIQRIIINSFITKNYKDINFNYKEKIEKQELNVVKKNVGGLIFHKIGDYLINGTDNIILSTFSILSVGLYSNYLLISNAVKSFIMTIFNAMIPSLGNLIVSESKDVQENTFKMMHFLGFLLFGYATICIYLLSNTFITIGYGKQYLLNDITVLFIAINVFLSGLRIVNCAIINAAGKTYNTRFDPVLQAIINVIVSMFLVKKYGVLGVVIGTTVSGVLITNWHTPFIIYRDVFEKNYSIYIKEILKNIITLLISGSICVMISNLFDVGILSFIMQAIVYLVIFTVIVIIFYYRSSQYKYYFGLLKKGVYKIWKKN